MAKKIQATRLPATRKATPKVPVIGVFATSDPRIDKYSRTRCGNVVKMVADIVAKAVVMPDKMPVPVVYSDVLVDGEAQADIVAQQFRKAGVDILVLVPDTWAFPQLTAISVLQQFPALCACSQRRYQPVRQACNAECRHLAGHRNSPGNDRADRKKPYRLVLCCRDQGRFARSQSRCIRSRFHGYGNRSSAYHPDKKQLRYRNHPSGYEASG
ncbi:MAG: hypothetical protein ACYSRZ_04165 [Planctomycetota bacterium]